MVSFLIHEIYLATGRSPLTFLAVKRARFRMVGPDALLGQLDRFGYSFLASSRLPGALDPPQYAFL